MADIWNPNSSFNQNAPSFGESVKMGQSYGGTQSDQNWAKALDLGLKIFGGAGGSSDQDKWRNEAEESGEREEKWKQAYQAANTAKVADNLTIYEPGRELNPGQSFLQQGLQQGASGGGGGGGSTWGKIAAGAGTALSAGAAAGVLGPVAAIAGPVLGLFCDERLKTDIAPLERSDVHDELAEMAFLVKEIRECA